MIDMGAVRAEVETARAELLNEEDNPKAILSLGARKRVWRAMIDPAGPGARGVPQTISCRISAHLSVDSLPQLGQQVRDAVRAACHENLGVSPTVNVHIEDLHDDD